MTSGGRTAVIVALVGLVAFATRRVLPAVREIRAWRPEPTLARIAWRPVDREELTHVTELAIARVGSLRDEGSPVVQATSDEPITSEPFVSRTPAPALELRGVTGGPPWRGIVRGLPGTQGDVVVRAGDRFHELVVMRIDARGLLAVWQDSTWVVKIGSGDR